MLAIWCVLSLALVCEGYYYGGELSRNTIEEAAALPDSLDMRDKLWRLPLTEECREREGKKCLYGTYFNEICGRQECFSGPDEECTEKLEFDTYGKRCARGYECSKRLGTCVGLRSQNLSPPLSGWYQLLQRRRVAE